MAIVTKIDGGKRAITFNNDTEPVAVYVDGELQENISFIPDNATGTTSITYQSEYKKNLIDLEVEGNTKEQSLLPSEYQQVEYIESTGTQYIDTEVLASENNSFEVKAQLVHTNTTSQTIWGGRENSALGSNQLACIKSSGTYQFVCGNTAQASYSYDFDIHIIKSDKNELYIDGKLIYTTPSATITTQNNVYLFATNNGGTVGQNGGDLKIYYCKIWKNETLLRNLIPCYRKSDNVVGMYDIVNDAFYINSGTGEFVKSKPSPNLDYPQPIESSIVNGIELSGKNLCDLEYFKKSAMVSQYWYVPVFVGTGNTVTVSLPEKYPTGLGFYLCVSYEKNKGSGNVGSWGWLYSSSSNSLCRKSITFKASEDYIYINIGNTGQCYKYVDYLQVELGNVATEYEPYLEPKTISIPNISLAKIDISADKLTVNYGNKSVIKSGYSQYLNVADCELSLVAGSNSSYVLIDIENIPRPRTFNAPYGVGICNVCAWQTEEITDLPQGEISVGASSNRLRLYISQSLVSEYVKTTGSGLYYITVEDFKTWLSSHPIEILYSTSSKQSIDYSQETWATELLNIPVRANETNVITVNSSLPVTKVSANYAIWGGRYENLS